MITGGGLPSEISMFLENTNFEAIDVSSIENNQRINTSSDCDTIPVFPSRMWGAMSTLGFVSRSTYNSQLQYLFRVFEHFNV